MMKRLILLFVLLLVAAPAHADIYAQPNWNNLIKTLIRFGSLEMNDDRLIDEYTMVTDCDIYKTFVPNDFKWQKVRDAVRLSIEMNREKFPGSYVYEDKLALGTYDFQQQMYRFSDKNPLQKVNAFFLYRTDGKACGTGQTNYLPRSFRAILDESVSLPGLPLTQRSADALLRRMEANNNKDRLVFVRFNLHVNYIGKVDKPEAGGMETVYRQQGAAPDAPVLLNTQVDTIDFYEDELHRKLLYSYQP